MATLTQQAFLLAQMSVMLVGTALLATVGWLTLESFFVVSFLGLAVVTVLTAPARVVPPWRLRLRWPLLVAGVLFAALVALRTAGKILAAL